MLWPPRQVMCLCLKCFERKPQKLWSAQNFIVFHSTRREESSARAEIHIRHEVNQAIIEMEVGQLGRR